jgi:hypothetical protein
MQRLMWQYKLLIALRETKRMILLLLGLTINFKAAMVPQDLPLASPQ